MSVVNSEENCTLLKDSFANSTAEFISCAIYNSRPITMCENCVQQYINILEDYNNMKKVTIE
jgi:F0F1-type ATP synthase delta subunit